MTGYFLKQIGCAAVILCAVSLRPLQAEYRSPQWSVLPYDPAQSSLTAPERTQLADALSDFARSINGDTIPNNVLRAKAVALALRLDSENKSAVVANAQFKRGVVNAANSPSISRENLEKMFLLQVKKMQAQAGGQDPVLAGYVLDFLSAADPANEDLIYQAEMAQQKNPVNWTPILQPDTPAPTAAEATASASKPSTAATSHSASAKPRLSMANLVPTTPAAELKRQQSKVKGLVVMESDGSSLGGKVTEIIITAKSTLARNTSECSFTTEVGGDMQTAQKEAFRTATLRHPEFQKGVKFDFSFDDKYTKKSGGSAGTAFAVGMLSIMEDITLDPDAALTGDITVDGKTRKVGGVPLKIRGAKTDGCKIVGIPSDNEGDVGNLMVLDGFRAIEGIQIFSLNTLDDAVSMARQDRPESLSRAVKIFNEVQDSLDKGGALSNPEVAAKLDEVLKLAPNHLSAKYLKMKVDGSAPTILTPSAALNEIFELSSPVLVFFRTLDKEARRPVTYGSVMVLRLSPQTYAGIRTEMGKLEKKIPPQIQDIYYAMVTLIDHIENFDEQYKGMPHKTAFAEYQQLFRLDLPRRERLQEIITQYRALVDNLAKLDYDKDFVESELR